MSNNSAFLGKGWSFPPTFDKDSRSVVMTSGKEDIDRSLEILLSTRLGERVMLPEYGCDLSVLLFQSVDSVLIAFVKDLVETAILLYEPRIDAKRVDILTDRLLEGVLLIEIDYVIRTTNSRANFVYPFYQKEGTNLQR